MLQLLRLRLRHTCAVCRPQPPRQEPGMHLSEVPREFTLPERCAPPFLDACVGHQSQCSPAHHEVLYTDITGRMRRVGWHRSPVDPASLKRLASRFTHSVHNYPAVHNFTNTEYVLTWTRIMSCPSSFKFASNSISSCGGSKFTEADSYDRKTGI